MTSALLSHRRAASLGLSDDQVNLERYEDKGVWAEFDKEQIVIDPPNNANMQLSPSSNIFQPFDSNSAFSSNSSSSFSTRLSSPAASDLLDSYTEPRSASLTSAHAFAQLSFGSGANTPTPLTPNTSVSPGNQSAHASTHNLHALFSGHNSYGSSLLNSSGSNTLQPPSPFANTSTLQPPPNNNSNSHGRHRDYSSGKRLTAPHKSQNHNHNTFSGSSTPQSNDYDNQWNQSSQSNNGSNANSNSNSRPSTSPSTTIHDSHEFNPASVPSVGVMDEQKLKKYKTAMCQRMVRTGGCRYGQLCDFAHDRFELRRNLDLHWHYALKCEKKQCSDIDCRYAHNDHEVMYHPRIYKTRLCTNFTKPSGCNRKMYCSFAHGKNELRTINPNTLTSPMMMGPGVPQNVSESPNNTHQTFNTSIVDANSQHVVAFNSISKTSTSSSPDPRLTASSNSPDSRVDGSALLSSDTFRESTDHLKIRVLDIVDELGSMFYERACAEQAIAQQNTKATVIKQEVALAQCKQAISLLNGDDITFNTFHANALDQLSNHLQQLLNKTYQAKQRLLSTDVRCVSCSSTAVSFLLTPCCHYLCSACTSPDVCVGCHSGVASIMPMQEHMPNFAVPMQYWNSNTHNHSATHTQSQTPNFALNHQQQSNAHHLNHPNNIHSIHIQHDASAGSYHDSPSQFHATLNIPSSLQNQRTISPIPPLSHTHSPLLSARQQQM